jgi:hypothetical protein
MCNYAFEAYYLASRLAGIDIEARDDRRVVQAEGDAAASKGYHHSDGILDGHSYTAAADFSVRGLTHTQIATWLEALCSGGWVAFFRNWPGNLHIHANYCGVPQKRSLDGQNLDFFAGRDGLVGHRRIDDEWWYPEFEVRKIAEKMFRQSNPKSGEAKLVRTPLVTPPLDQSQTNGFYLNDEAKPRFWMPVYDDVSYAPVRAFGTALGFDTEYLPDKHIIAYDGDEIPVALKMIAGVGHAPIRQLTREVGLRVLSVAPKKVVVGH